MALLFVLAIHLYLHNGFKMQERGQIVRMVNTYTTIDSRFDRSAGKSRKKGITRVVQQPQSQSKETAIDRATLHCEVYQTYNDQNQNYSNRKQPPLQSNQELIEKVSQLQTQLFRVEQEKNALQRQLLGVEQQLKKPEDVSVPFREVAASSPSFNLVQSHYMTCKQDIQKWNTERGVLEEKINVLEEKINVLNVENNFLKMNVGIHEQYILKMEQQLHSLRAKQTAEMLVQTEQVPKDAATRERSVQSDPIIGSNEESNRWSQIVQSLNIEKVKISVENDELVVKLAKLELELEQSKASLSKETELSYRRREDFETRITVYKEEITQLTIKTEQLENQLVAVQNEKLQLAREIEGIRSIDGESLHRQKQQDREDARYLLKKIDQYQINDISLKQQKDSLLEQLSRLSTQLEQKTVTLGQTRAELVDLSHRHQQTLNLYSKAMQEKVELLSQLNASRAEAQSAEGQFQRTSLRYSSQIRQLQLSFGEMQSRIEEQSRRELAMEQECENKMAMVKKDYDVLYCKYIKYKNMALLLHPKDNKI